MNENNLILSPHAQKILKERSRGWEFLLLGQTIDDEINLIKLIANNDLIKSIHKSKFIHIKNIEELGDVIQLLDKSEFFMSASKIILEMQQTNELVFGASGVPGNPFLIQLLGKRVANLYYQLLVWIKEIEFDINDYKIFLSRNLNSNIKGYKIIGNAIETTNLHTLDVAQSILSMIENYHASCVNDLKPLEERIVIKSKAVNEKLSQNMYSAQELACVYFENGEGLLDISKNQSKIVQKFNDLADVANWMLSQEQIKLADLKGILLPLNYFPGVFIDAINEKALDLAGDVALAEDKEDVFINQDVLRQVCLSEDFYFL